MSSEAKKPTKKKTAIKLPEYKSMMLVNNVFMPDNNPTPLANFTLIPLTEDCPFIEGIFDPEKKILALVTKFKKSQFHYVTKIDTNGMPKPNSNKALRDKQPFAQDRILIETFHEHYLRDPKEIEAFIEAHAINADFDWKSFLK